MRVPLIPFIAFLVICVPVDLYIRRVLLTRCRCVRAAKWYSVISCVIYAVLIAAVCVPRRSGSNGQLAAVMWIFFGALTLYLPKLLFVIIDAMACLPKLWRGKRWRYLSWIGVTLAAFLFCDMWWGALVTRFEVNVVSQDIYVKNLPDDMDGYRLAQISDLHVGTYGTDTTYIDKLVNEVNSLDVDAVVFTGDIVNRRSEELLPFVTVFSRLTAPDGVYAILGNHDYGDYSDWESPAAKALNMTRLYDYYRDMGWRLLRNEHVYLKKGNDSIALIGVENIGDPPFKVYGSLTDSYPMLSDSVTKVLLTHNPAHWDMEIADNDTVNIALSLSGHTHAMQMEVLGLSPAALRYPQWQGLYKDNSESHQLYVNIGIGAVGMPMRMGTPPEVTVITLKKAE
ncbi:MAG: metallophosphoesterase [Paramuribaculum sp.]|nr:metallophosphoesterase [Paramuribaculum sp.]